MPLLFEFTEQHLFILFASAGALIGVVGIVLFMVRSRALNKLKTDHEILTEQMIEYRTLCDTLTLQSSEYANQLTNTQVQLESKSTLITQLQTALKERERFHQAQLIDIKQQRKQLHEDFERLAQKALHHNRADFSKSQEHSMRLLLEPFQTQIKGFSQQVQQFQNTNISSQASLTTELDHLRTLNQKMSQEAQSLSQALKGNKKVTGNWGEMQLERCLQASGLQPNTHYLKEKSYLDAEQQHKRPDFIIKLPDQKDIIIDSKVSLIDFTKAIESTHEKAQNAAMANHIKALKKHIDSLNSKDYSALKELRTPNFVLMFIPVEPAFLEAIKFDDTLYDYGLERNIILVSPTTLIPLLKTIAQLWLMDNSHNKAYELAQSANELYQQIFMIGERLQKLGRTLSTTTLQYNDVITALAGRQGLYQKAEKFGDVANNMQPMPELQTLQKEIDETKLLHLASHHREQSLHQALNETPTPNEK